MEIPVLGFGSSDKKSKSHLFYGKIEKYLPRVLDRSEKKYAFFVITSPKAQ